MKKSAILALTLTFVLAACGGNPPENKDGDRVTPDEPALPTEQPSDTDALSDTSGRIADPSGPGTSDLPRVDPKVGEAVAAIPAPIQGRWALVPGDCTSTRGDAKGLLKIGPKTLEFYESRGIMASVKEKSASTIVAEFDFSGEGETWKRTMTLDLQDDGQTLVRHETGKGAAAGPIRYASCGT